MTVTGFTLLTAACLIIVCLMALVVMGIMEELDD